MATDKLFTVCGTSKQAGEYKVRFANDTMRIKVLAKHGHEDITLIELPQAMSKLEAVKFIKTVDEFEGAGAQSAIADYLDRKDEAPKPVKATPVAKVKATAPKAPAKTKTTATVVENEDAPF